METTTESLVQIGKRVIYNNTEVGTITKIGKCNNETPTIVQVTMDNKLLSSDYPRVCDISINFLKPYTDPQLTENVDTRTWPEPDAHREVLNILGRILNGMDEDSGAHAFKTESLIEKARKLAGPPDGIKFSLTVEELRKFHNKTLGLNNDERWNMLRVLEKNAWAKYYWDMQGKEIDISQIAGDVKACLCKGTSKEYNSSCERRDYAIGSHDMHFYNSPELTEGIVYPCIMKDGKIITNPEFWLPKPDTSFSEKLHYVCSELESMLMEKNKAYGDSALNPICIFAKGNPQDLIRVRIDDKLTRIKNLGDTGGDPEDAELDLLGYLILLKISKL